MVPQTVEHIGELAFAGIGGSGEWQKMMDNIANMYGGIFEVVDTAGEPIEGGLYDSYLISAQNEAVKKYCEDPEMESWGMNIHHTSSITDKNIEKNLQELMNIKVKKEDVYPNAARRLRLL